MYHIACQPFFLPLHPSTVSFLSKYWSSKHVSVCLNNFSWIGCYDTHFIPNTSTHSSIVRHYYFLTCRLPFMLHDLAFDGDFCY